MPNIYQNEDFEMSVVAKRWWKYTRKYSNTYGGVTLPGLFQTRQYTFDLFLFLLIIACEVIGVINLIKVGNFNVVFVWSLFALDLLFAFCAHLPKGRILEMKNRFILTEDDALKANIKRQIFIRRFISITCKVVIVTIASFKVISFITLYGVFDGISFLICITYAIAAFLHIYATGYFLFELALRIKIFFEHNAFLSHGKVNSNPYWIKRTRPHNFISNTLLVEFQVNRHKLFKRNNDYILETWGILTDEELQSIIAQQENHEQRRIIAIEGLIHQLEILTSDPA